MSLIRLVTVCTFSNASFISGIISWAESTKYSLLNSSSENSLLMAYEPPWCPINRQLGILGSGAAETYLLWNDALYFSKNFSNCVWANCSTRCHLHWFIIHWFVIHSSSYILLPGPVSSHKKVPHPNKEVTNAIHFNGIKFWFEQPESRRLRINLFFFCRLAWISTCSISDMFAGAYIQLVYL